jgi:flagellar basal-body rod protein FlgB
MSDLIVNDGAMKAARFALDGLALKQVAIGNNLANVDTPGYQTQTVDFQSALKQALKREDETPLRMAVTNPGHLQAGERTASAQTMFRTGGSVRADGNNVDVEVELTELAETGITYQAMTQLVSKKLLLLKNIADRR